MSEIIYHQKYGSAVTKRMDLHGSTPKKTTQGWGVLIEYKDEKTTQLDIKDVKEASLIDLDEYAVANQIADDPEFSWWVPYTLDKSNRIISKFKTKYWSTAHKYELNLTKNVMETIHIYQANGNTYCKYEIDIEMKKANIDYKPREGCKPK